MRTYWFDLLTLPIISFLLATSDNRLHLASINNLDNNSRNMIRLLQVQGATRILPIHTERESRYEIV